MKEFVEVERRDVGGGAPKVVVGVAAAAWDDFGVAYWAARMVGMVHAPDAIDSRLGWPNRAID